MRQSVFYWTRVCVSTHLYCSKTAGFSVDQSTDIGKDDVRCSGGFMEEVLDFFVYFIDDGQDGGISGVSIAQSAGRSRRFIKEPAFRGRNVQDFSG